MWRNQGSSQTICWWHYYSIKNGKGIT